MAVNVMQPTNRLLVERDASTNTELLIVKFVSGSSGPTVANEMQPTNYGVVGAAKISGRLLTTAGAPVARGAGAAPARAFGRRRAEVRHRRTPGLNADFFQKEDPLYGVR